MNIYLTLLSPDKKHLFHKTIVDTGNLEDSDDCDLNL